MQPLGPNQERWLAALESGEFEQGRGYLCQNGRYCVIGVGCELFAMEDKRGYGTGIVFWRMDWAFATPSVIEALSLYNKVGISRDGRASLASFNDTGKTFAEITAIIRSDPSMWFREPR